MQTLDELNDTYGITGLLAFEAGEGGLACARVSTQACSATLYLQGAHMTQWQPQGQEPVLFVSEKSVFAAGHAIRGGVPVVFPWFGARSAELTGGRTDGPSHGFARTQLWEVAFAAMAGEDLHLSLVLSANETSRALGFDKFRVVYEMVLGRTLTLRLGVLNGGEVPLRFEQALHSYFAVGDAEQVRIEGLAGAEYLDKTDGFKRKRQEELVLTLRGETDRPYLNTEATVTLDDPVKQRKIVVTKRGSKSTVVWNPWAELAAKMPDMSADGWRQMTCIETANVADNALTLRPREAYMMEAVIAVEALRPVVSMSEAAG